MIVFKLLLTVVAATPGTGLREDMSSYFISGDYADLAEIDGEIYAATGYGVARIPSGFDTLIHYPSASYSTRLAAVDDRLYLGEGSMLTEFMATRRGLEPGESYDVEGRITAVAGDDEVLAVGTDSMKVVLFSPQGGMDKLGEVLVGDRVADVCVHKGLVYAAADYRGVFIIEPSDRPSIKARVDIKGAKSLAVAGGRLLVGTAGAEMVILDAADPSSVREIERFPTGFSVVSMAYSRDYLYTAQGYGGFAVFDLGGKRVEPIQEVREGYVSDVLVTEKAVCLALKQRGLVKLEGRRPGDLARTASVGQGSPVVHTSSAGSYWGVARGKAGVSILRYEGEGSLSMGIAEPEPSDARGVLLSGTYLYVADSDEGVSIFDMRTFPSAERELHLLQSGSPRRLALSQDLIYLAAGSRGARVLWVCPCGPLKERSELKDINAADVAAYDSVVYIADPDSGLRITVIRDEGQNIEQVGVYPGVISAQALLRDQQVLYVADSVGAVIALDVSRPKNPEQLWFDFIGTRPYGLGKSGDTLYVACGEQGVLPIDVSSEPVNLDFIETPGRALAVAAVKGNLGIADYTSWVLIRGE